MKAAPVDLPGRALRNEVALPVLRPVVISFLSLKCPSTFPWLWPDSGGLPVSGTPVPRRHRSAVVTMTSPAEAVWREG